MQALIDGDIVGFSCAAFNEKFGWEAVVEDIDAMMKRILETVGADSHQTFITGPNNFRYDIYSEYKANRRGKPQPVYRREAEEYLIENWGAQRTSGYEADDGIGIAASSGTIFTVCSIDKDLMMIPGRHYNWRRDEFTEVDHLDGMRSFYRSLLMGDAVDNIDGVGGVGKVKSARFINDLTSEVDMYQVCRALYKNDDERLLRNARLLWILRAEGQMWEPPHIQTIESTGEQRPV